MISGFIGKMGSGKTLSMTKEILKYYVKGYTIYSNYHLNIPHKKVNFDELIILANKQTGLNNAVIALDEIHILLDSRSGMSNKSKLITFWLNQTRKMKVKLLYTTQYLHQIDKRLRSGTDFFIFCNGVKLFYKESNKRFFVCYNELSDGSNNKREVFIGDKFFKYYNTDEIIGFGGKFEGKK